MELFITTAARTSNSTQPAVGKLIFDNRRMYAATASGRNVCNSYICTFVERHFSLFRTRKIKLDHRNYNYRLFWTNVIKQRFSSLLMYNIFILTQVILCSSCHLCNLAFCLTLSVQLFHTVNIVHMSIRKIRNGQFSDIHN
jgi:hypothetical protein